MGSPAWPGCRPSSCSACHRPFAIDVTLAHAAALHATSQRRAGCGSFGHDPALRKHDTAAGHARAWRSGRHLLDQEDVQRVWHGHLPPSDHTQQRGLAHAIGPHQAVAAAVGDGQQRVLQQNLALGAHRQVVHLLTGVSRLARWRWTLQRARYMPGEKRGRGNHGERQAKWSKGFCMTARHASATAP